jgi:acetyl esterase/lipase
MLAELAGGELYRSPLGRDETLEVDGRSIGLRILAPETAPTGIYLWLHGSGWTIASPDLFDAATEEIVRQTGMAVVGVNYRKAPEHPFPAPLEDCVEAARWLIANAEAEFGTTRLTIGGDSSGANLAVATLLRLRDEDGAHERFDAVNLWYGFFDATLLPSAHGPNGVGGIVGTAHLEWYADQYIPADVDRRNPLISPLYADLAGLPPALLSVGTQDPLLDDSLLMHCRLLAQGVESELRLYPGGGHGFEIGPTSIAATAKQRVAEFLASAVA